MSSATKRSDFFVTKKGVHVSLDKELNRKLRIKLYENNLSIQEVFNEFVNFVINDHKQFNKLAETIIKKKLKQELLRADIRTKAHEEAASAEITQVDKETMYSLINDALEKKKVT